MRPSGEKSRMSTRPQRARSHTKACDEAMEGPGQAPPVADSCAKKCKSNIATSVVLLRASVPLVCPLRYRLPPALSGEAGAVSFRYSVPFFFSAAMEVCVRKQWESTASCITQTPRHGHDRPGRVKAQRGLVRPVSFQRETAPRAPSGKGKGDPFGRHCKIACLSISAFAISEMT